MKWAKSVGELEDAMEGHGLWLAVSFWRSRVLEEDLLLGSGEVRVVTRVQAGRAVVRETLELKEVPLHAPI
jgi:hypothetical protein